MKRLNDDKELLEFDGVTETIVYMNSFSELVKAELKWRDADEDLCQALCLAAKVLTLSEIAEQLKDKCCMITIFVEGPTSGKIFQYGNYGDNWWEVGSTCGYA